MLPKCSARLHSIWQQANLDDVLRILMEAWEEEEEQAEEEEEAAVKEMYAAFDTNTDGVLDYTEFSNLVGSICKSEMPNEEQVTHVMGVACTNVCNRYPGRSGRAHHPPEITLAIRFAPTLRSQMLDLFDEALKGADDGEDIDAITPSGMVVVARRLQLLAPRAAHFIDPLKLVSVRRAASDMETGLVTQELAAVAVQLKRQKSIGAAAFQSKMGSSPRQMHFSRRATDYSGRRNRRVT